MIGVGAGDFKNVILREDLPTVSRLPYSDVVLRFAHEFDLSSRVTEY